MKKIERKDKKKKKRDFYLSWVRILSRPISFSCRAAQLPLLYRAARPTSPPLRSHSPTGGSPSADRTVGSQRAYGFNCRTLTRGVHQLIPRYCLPSREPRTCGSLRSARSSLPSRSRTATNSRDPRRAPSPSPAAPLLTGPIHPGDKTRTPCGSLPFPTVARTKTQNASIAWIGVEPVNPVGAVERMSGEPPGVKLMDAAVRGPDSSLGA